MDYKMAFYSMLPFTILGILSLLAFLILLLYNS